MKIQSHSEMGLTVYGIIVDQVQQRREPSELRIPESLHAPAVGCSDWLCRFDVPIGAVQTAGNVCSEIAYSTSKPARWSTMPM